MQREDIIVMVLLAVGFYYVSTSKCELPIEKKEEMTDLEKQRVLPVIENRVHSNPPKEYLLAMDTPAGLKSGVINKPYKGNTRKLSSNISRIVRN